MGTLTPPEARKPRTPEPMLFPARPCRAGRRVGRDPPYLEPHPGPGRWAARPSTAGLLRGERTQPQSLCWEDEQPRGGPAQQIPPASSLPAELTLVHVPSSGAHCVRPCTFCLPVPGLGCGMHHDWREALWHGRWARSPWTGGDPRPRPNSMGQSLGFHSGNRSRPQPLQVSYMGAHRHAHTCTHRQICGVHVCTFMHAQTHACIALLHLHAHT